MYMTFNRDKTGLLEYTGWGQAERKTFTWSYERGPNILTVNGDSVKVEYNLFRTKAWLYDMDGDSYLTLTLRSTPIFRL